jgi:hypothetical protein
MRWMFWEQRNIPCFCWEPTHDSSFVQPVTESVCLLIINKNKSRDVGYATKVWTRPEGFRRYRLPDFPGRMHIKVVRSSALSTGRPSRHETSLPHTHFCYRLIVLRGHSAAGRIEMLYIDIIKNWNMKYENYSTYCKINELRSRSSCFSKAKFKKRRYFRQIVITYSRDSFPAQDPGFGARDLIV